MQVACSKALIPEKKWHLGIKTGPIIEEYSQYQYLEKKSAAINTVFMENAIQLVGLHHLLFFNEKSILIRVGCALQIKWEWANDVIVFF